jgi:hypothetical protein
MINRASQVYDSGFMADVVKAVITPLLDRNDAVPLNVEREAKGVSKLVGIRPGAAASAMPAEPVSVDLNSQVIVGDSYPRSSS